LKILFIHNKYNQPGGEDVVLSLGNKLLTERGHETRTLFFSNPGAHEFLKKIRTGFSLIYNFNSARKLRKVIREFKPEVIHVHNIFFSASPSVFYIAAKFRVPVILTLHNYRLICANALLLRKNRVCEKCIQKKFPLSGLRYACYRNSRMLTALVILTTGIHKLLKTWKNKITLFISLNDFSRSKFSQSSLGIPENKIVMIPNFTDDHGASPDPRENYFLFAGRLAREKGIDILCRAFQSMPDLPLLILGDGPERNSLQHQYRNHPNIRFMGQVEKREMVSCMKRCKAFICPSIWYEGAPLTIIEAFSTGTPVIASRLGSMSETIVHGYNGFHFDPGNAEDLARTIRLFLDKQTDKRQLYLNARQSYLDKYHPDRHYQSLMKSYRQAINDFV